MTSQTVHNFGKNVSFTPAMFAEPKNEAELLQIMRQQGARQVRVVASRHAWSDAIKTNGLLISVKHLDQVTINQESGTVSVGAGCQIKHLIAQLRTEDLTLPSLGLIDEQTVAGATSTGTHGSGKHSLSHYVKRIRVAHFDPQTDEPTISEIESGIELQAAKCSLGLLGVIVQMDLETRPVYQVQEHSQRHASLNSVLEAEKQYPLQQFFLMPWSWHWFGQHRVETKNPRSRSAGLYGIYWHLGIDWGLHLLIFLLAKLIGIRGLIRAFYRFFLPLVIVRRWRVTDDSHRILTMEHELFRHIEIEVFVTRSDLESALEHVKNAIVVFGGKTSAAHQNDQHLPIPDGYHGTYCHHYPICVRRILSDDTLISMASPSRESDTEDWYAISLISYHWPSRRAGFFGFAKYLASSMSSRFDARCHWGKYNPLDRDTNERLYPNLAEFRKVTRRFDSESRFANEWLSDVLLNESDEFSTESV